MGMDYIAVYEGDEAEPSGLVKIPAGRLQELGVKITTAGMHAIDRRLSSVGTIEVAEPRVHTVAPRFGGWIEKLHVDATGIAVRRGTPLFEVYSPELVTAQQEYLIALDAGMESLADGSLQRLRNWDLPASLIEGLKRDRKPRRTITIVAPVDGTVLEKAAVAGMRFMPGEMLYKLADLSSVWVVAAVAEQELPGLAVGQRVRFETPSSPGRSFVGRVQMVLPTIAADTRTLQVRIELANTDRVLKPAMSGRVMFESPEAAVQRLAIPNSAVIDSGTRQVVLLEQGPGRFAPREVQLGVRGESFVEVKSGLESGDRIVESGNFLIDAESNLRGALAGMGTAAADPAIGAAEPATTLPDAHQQH
jgi:Cu(I)/Ag(I) efflux system membrane fusion protein